MTGHDFSNAVVAYVGLDNSSVPGRHPDRVPFPHLRESVDDLVRRLDAIRPDHNALDLFDCAEREVDELLIGYPTLSVQAREALVSLLSFTWR